MCGTFFAQGALISAPFWVTAHYHPPSYMIAYLLLPMMMVPALSSISVNKFLIARFEQQIIIAIAACLPAIGGMVLIAGSYLVPNNYWWLGVPGMLSGISLTLIFPFVHINGFRQITGNHNSASSIITCSAYLAGGCGTYVGSLVSIKQLYIYGILMFLGGAAMYLLHRRDRAIHQTEKNQSDSAGMQPRHICRQ